MAKDPDILQAVRDQDAQALERILCKHRSKLRLGSGSKKLNVNYQDEDGMSALHQAALQGNVDCMKLLLECSACSDIKDNKGMRPLHYAAWQGLLEPVTLLLSHDASPRDAADDGDTPLHFASQHGHLEVVTLLLQRGADPTVKNRNRKTSLDLACEFGRLKVAEHLVLSGLCDGLLSNLGGNDLADNTRTTCLHLASRNGHADVISLLLQADVDINHQTAQGTALHEAALYGKTNVVRLLIEKGIDINLPNSFDQTALDIVNKFTKKAGAKELKALLIDASTAVRAKATKDYANPYDPHSLSLRVGDIVTVLEQRPDGISRGFLTNTGSLTRAAYFPSNCVTVIDTPQSAASGDRQPYSYGASAPGRPPDRSDLQLDSTSGAAAHGRFVAEDGTPIFSPPPLYRAPDPGYSTAPLHYQFPLPPPSPLSTMAAIPEGRLQGYDQATISRLSASSRDSRGSLSHYSCGSGAGSAQSYAHSMAMQQQQQRLSGQGYEPTMRDGGVGGGTASAGQSQGVSNGGASSARQSVNSVSSCCSSSLGDSAERLLESVYSGESSGYSSGSVNVAELFMQGLSDADVLHMWLSELHYEAYYDCFLDAGYDMATISRMTPEDLTAIGITKPGHRRRLKAEISRLNINDGIPDYKPASVAEWLQMLRLEPYLPILLNGQYDAVEKVAEMIWEDLEDLGIQKLGHQKKMMLAIEKLKRACKRQSSTSAYSTCSGGGGGSYSCSGGGTAVDALSIAASLSLASRWSADMTPADASLPRSHYSRPQHQPPLHHLPRACSQPSDIVAITVKTGVSRSSSGNSVNSGSGGGSEYAQQRCKSFADGVAPQSLASSDDSSGGGSLPRGRGPLRAIHGTPMAKAAAAPDGEHQQWDGMDGVSPYATLRRRPSSRSTHSAPPVPCEFALPAALRQSAAGSGGCEASAPRGTAPPPSPGATGGGIMASPFANFKSPYSTIQTGQVRNVMTMSASGRVEWGGSALPVAAAASEQAATRASPHQQPQLAAAAPPQLKKPPPPPRRSNSLTSSKPPPDVERSKRADADSGICLVAAAPDGHASPVPSELDVAEVVTAFPPLPPPMAFDMQHMKVHKNQRQQSAAAAAAPFSAAATSSQQQRKTSSSGSEGEAIDDVVSTRVGMLHAMPPAAAAPLPQQQRCSDAAEAAATSWDALPASALSAVLESGLAVRRRAAGAAAASAAAAALPSSGSSGLPDASSVLRDSSGGGASARSSGAGDGAFLPFANENVGTIRQRPAGPGCAAGLSAAAAEWQTSGGHVREPVDQDTIEMHAASDEQRLPRFLARPVGQVQPVVFYAEQTRTLLLTELPVANGPVATGKPVRDVFSDLDCELQHLSHELELELENMALEYNQ